MLQTAETNPSAMKHSQNHAGNSGPLAASFAKPEWTGAAGWLAQQTLGQMGLSALPVVGVIAALSVFSIVPHLGFASATGLASTLIPIMIPFTQTLPVSPETAFGIVMIQSFVVSFGFILPTNAPQNMLCYGTNAFNTAQFAKVGIVVTLAGLGLILLLSATLWPAMGVL